MKKIIGHKKIIDRLNRHIERGSFSHAHLFVGPKNIGKGTAALEIARKLICSEENACGICQDCVLFSSGNHPDILKISKEESIKIEDSRKIKEFCSFKPFRAKSKIIIIESAENLTREAGNSLLKIIEEPDGFCYFIFTASYARNIPETIVSRCQISAFGLVSSLDLIEFLEEKDLSETEKNLLLRRSAGKPGLLLDLISNEKEEDENIDVVDLLCKGNYLKKFKLAEELSKKEDLSETLNQITLFFRDFLLLKNGIFDKIMYPGFKELMFEKADRYKHKKIKEILRATKNIQEGLGKGLNTRLSLENLFILMEER